ncbi:MAG: hypothetical protein COV74_04455 [Candidatus Omnitrophica bacterium CG11_big_fil_rev_8_21_14_0_20_45_26]|uniref:Type II secretion system protein GspC N-terminal domain-containing protein n=1 Tax=Candidatus Abzuiibacterium crystallinum TaxID=1974748 RepID=A0A2H0LQ51_9BACT|nr:MAG: hypothetical protein COV74_04455 [Candidatus Omnitrophica bacterium CG11_big_fil_rev_8_21_14_0_20_45_26]PIW64279.1 MAG: hypothetical protein COW12_06975 [Candidatus Omnitrophica bacterium CG12_big_fil_rev_8_21_14_0_65_45_16]
MADSDASATPEKKLLNLIEGQQSEDSGSKTAAGGTVDKSSPGQKVNVAALLSPSALKGRIEFFRDQITALVKGGEPINFRQVNQVVRIMTVLVTIGLTGAIAYEMMTVQHSLGKELTVTPQEIAELTEADQHTIDPNLFQEVEKRNIFIPKEKRAAEQAPEQDESSLKFVEITNNLKLAGISISPEDPSRTYCMVEDISKNVTNFLKVGDMISGLKVEQINPDGVVLKFQNQSVELR